jgi:hypothetical protein
MGIMEHLCETEAFDEVESAADILGKMILITI